MDLSNEGELWGAWLLGSPAQSTGTAVTTTLRWSPGVQVISVSRWGPV